MLIIITVFTVYGEENAIELLELFFRRLFQKMDIHHY